MDINPLIWLTGVVFVVGVIFWIFKRTRPKPHCPYCGSKEVVEISRETIGTRTLRFLNSPAGGEDIRLQVTSEVLYHCRDCDKRHTRTIRETR